MSTNPSPDTFAIEFKLQHWVLILAGVEILHKSAMKKLEQMRAVGDDGSSFSDAEVMALGGPAVVRGILVKELAARGHMTQEADERAGIDSLMKNVREALGQS